MRTALVAAALLLPSLAFAQTVRVTGRVVDRESGKPIANALVELSNPGGGQGFFRAKTGGDGRFTLDRVPPDRWYGLVASADGYADFQIPSWQFPPAQRGAELVIPLDRAGTLEVRVTGTDGRTPVASAKVTIRAEGGGRWWLGYRPPPPARWTDAKGVATFADVEAGAWTVQVEAPGYTAKEMRNVAARRGDRTVLAVPVAHPAQLSGHVRLADGSAAAGLSITARGTGEAVTTTGPDGDFSFGELDPGRWRIEASHEGFESATLKQSITLREGESRAGIALTVTPRPMELAFVLNREVFTPGQKVRIGQRSFRVGRVDYTLDAVPADLLTGPAAPLRAIAAGDTTGLERLDAWSRVTASGAPWSWREEEIEVPGELEPGAYVLHGTVGGLRRHVMFYVSDVGLLVKRSPTRLLVSAASLRTGVPLAGVPIFLAAATERPARPAGRVSGALPPDGPRRAVTDSRGLASLDGTAGATGVRVTAASAVHGISIAESPLAPAAARGGDQVFLYTDRPIYRPGQTVHFKAFARRAIGRGYGMPSERVATLTMTGPEGATIAVAAESLSARGSFDGSIELPAEAALGDWSLVAKVGRASGAASLRVHEYRKPEYQVEVEAGRPSYVNGDEVTFRIGARYFFGSPVFGAAVRYTLFESRLRRDDDGDLDESESPVGFGRVLKSGESRLDRDGRVSLALVPERVSYDRTLTLDVEVVDGSNRAVSGRASTVMGRALFGLAVRPTRRVVTVGDAVAAEIVTRDFAGNPVSASVTVELDQDAWNPLERRYTRASRPLASQVVTTGSSGRTVVRLTPAPARSGQILVRARADDSRGNRVTDEAAVWVWDARVSEYAYRYPTLEAFADRDSYAPGDTAEIVVNTEVEGASVLAVVEGREIGEVQVVKIEGHTGRIAVPVTAAMSPNAFLALHVRKGKEVHSRVLELPVAAARHDLKITLTPDRDRYRPRDEATIAVETRDAAGSPVAAELSVGVVDEAIYALRRDDTRDPHDVFYGREPNWVSTVVAFPVLYYGGASKSGQDDVRRDFRDVALWAPTVTTGADGRAEVKLRYPDNLTTWRITGRGLTDDTKVGAATAKTLVTKDVLARLAGPRAFVAGDRARLVSVVTNRGDAPLTGVEESVEASGAVKLTGATSRKSDLSASGESRAAWNVEIPRELPAAAGGEGEAVLVMRARARTDADAVETRVPVLPRAVALRPAGGESVGGGSRTIPVTLPTDLMRGSSLTVELAASPAAVAWAGLDYLLRFPWSCTEQTANAIRPACALFEAAQSAKATPEGWEDPRARLQGHVTRLVSLALPEGGWGWWGGGEADPFLTALALDALARAERLKLTPPEAEGVLSQGAFRLLRELDQVRNEDAEAYVAAHVAPLLARPGARQRYTALAEWCDATLVVLASRPDALSPTGLALAGIATAGLGRSAAARPFVDALMKRAVKDAAGLHLPGTDDADAWFGDEIETTAYALSALCAVNPRDPRAGELAAWLAARRRGRDWRSTRTSAPAVLALADYARTHADEMRAEQAVTLACNGTKVLERTFTAADAWRAEPVRVTVPGGTLKPGANALTVTRAGGGPVFLSWEARALVPSPGPDTGAEKRLHVTREFLRAERTTDRRGRPQLLARPLLENETFGIGDAVLVRVTLRADRALRWIQVEDPRVAGLEVEEALPAGASRPWGTHAEVRDRSVSFFVDRLESGETVVEYLARAEIAGTFTALPISAGAMYDPGLLVRGPEQSLRIHE